MFLSVYKDDRYSGPFVNLHWRLDLDPVYHQYVTDNSSSPIWTWNL